MKTLSVLCIQMSMPSLPTYVVLLIAVLVGLAAVYRFRDHFVPEFIDDTNVRDTERHINSSYVQETNHDRPRGHLNLGPIQGTESPFRVNMFDSYIP